MALRDNFAIPPPLNACIPVLAPESLSLYKVNNHVAHAAVPHLEHYHTIHKGRLDQKAESERRTENM